MSNGSRLVRRVREVLGTDRQGGSGREDALAGGAVHSRYDQLPTLPEVPDGWSIGPPDFVIIGAQKSGTTWWQGLVEEHPDVVRPSGQRRELHYFDHFWDRWPTPGQIERYHNYFPRPPGSLAGEKTPGYLYQPWVAPMLAEAAPDTRLVAVLRDPIERYASGLGLLQRAGAIKGEIGAGEIGMREHRITEAIERGRYATQLEWYLARFRREQLLLLQYEACVADPQTQLTRTFEFLGLPDHAASADGIKRTRKQSGTRPAVPAAVRAMLASYYAGDIERLLRLMPELDLELWPGVADAAAGVRD